MMLLVQFQHCFTQRTKFPNFYQFVKQLHSMNVKVICWATSVVDTDSPNYNDGKQKGTVNLFIGFLEWTEKQLK